MNIGKSTYIHTCCFFRLFIIFKSLLFIIYYSLGDYYNYQSILCLSIFIIIVFYQDNINHIILRKTKSKQNSYVTEHSI